ncbi:hypothetical protein HPB50_005894 [Hyalomma asiaticum]|uniref:Uncharacterized protein n=1 Tax=Hyalomma asiaticum TaxID=266040 RepID=A0ACB7S3T2_HYAAI|nr:hypothetical protein HPB50_005894 [Hyalomma asiaticum]
MHSKERVSCRLRRECGKGQPLLRRQSSSCVQGFASASFDGVPVACKSTAGPTLLLPRLFAAAVGVQAWTDGEQGCRASRTAFPGCGSRMLVRPGREISDDPLCCLTSMLPAARFPLARVDAFAEHRCTHCSPTSTAIETRTSTGSGSRRQRDARRACAFFREWECVCVCACDRELEAVTPSVWLHSSGHPSVTPSCLSPDYHRLLSDAAAGPRFRHLVPPPFQEQEQNMARGSLRYRLRFAAASRDQKKKV